MSFGYHNFFVVVLASLAALWMAKVAHQMIIVIGIRQRLGVSRPLALDRMSIYAKDFQRLIRQHFIQILRMRRTVPPQEVSRHPLAVHLLPETIKVVRDHCGRLGVKFQVDARSPCSVRLYWGVSTSACNYLLKTRAPEASPVRATGVTAAASSASSASSQSPLIEPRRGVQRPPVAWSPARLSGPTSPPTVVLEIEQNSGADASYSGTEEARDLALGESVARSTTVVLAAGLRQTFDTPPDSFIEASRLGLELASRGPSETQNDSVMHLAVVISAKSAKTSTTGRTWDHNLPAFAGKAEAHGQVTFLRFQSEEGDQLRPEVLHQVVMGDSFSFRTLGIYGFEDDEPGGEAECMICYDRQRSVILMPCRHCSVCASCLRALREEKCPLCRSTFSAYLLLPLLQRGRAHQ